MDKVKIERVIPDVNQPRKYFAEETMTKLKESIKNHGIINPIIVEKKGNDFSIIDGERRYRAAQLLKLKEVPIIVVSAKTPFDRLVEQFHIQEQHEAWTIGEKAMAIMEIAELSGKTLEEIGEVLSIGTSALRQYVSFGKIVNKELFVRSKVSVRFAERINGLKAMVKSTKRKILEEPFTLADENKLEKVMIAKISSGEITSPAQFTRVIDSIRSEPKMIDVLLKGEMEVDTMFVKSKAQGAYHTRNLIHSAGYVNFHGEAFLAGKNVALNANDLNILKRAMATIKKVIDMAE